jgi:rubrerythrin
MGLVDPVKIYAATANVEAQMICRLLQGAGVEAFAGEDLSVAGLWLFGTIAGVFDAGVFVSRTDADRAVELIRQHERLEAERSNAQGSQVETTCEECGKTAAFPAAQRATVQSCPSCGAYLDVGEVDLPDDLGGGERRRGGRPTDLRVRRLPMSEG